MDEKRKELLNKVNDEEDYYDTRKATNDLEQGVTSMSDDSDLWELDVKPFLDRIYHELLGDVESEDGTWVRDEDRHRTMNELGASELIQEISIRISIHQQLSDLSDENILEIASRGAEIYADKLEDNWSRWDITCTESNFESIAQRLYDMLYIGLRIAKGGAMKRYRERKKNPYLRYPQSPSNVLEGVL